MYTRAGATVIFTLYQRVGGIQISLVMPYEQVPVELWLEIFEWATYNDNLVLANPKPFEPIPGTVQDPSLQIRLALYSVCKAWQSWMAQVLYKDIKIGVNTCSLHQALGRREQSGLHYGEMVRFCSATCVHGPNWSRFVVWYSLIRARQRDRLGL